MDTEKVETLSYMKDTILGGRQYCLKEPLSTLPKARMQLKAWVDSILLLLDLSEIDILLFQTLRIGSCDKGMLGHVLWLDPDQVGGTEYGGVGNVEWITGDDDDCCLRWQEMIREFIK